MQQKQWVVRTWILFTTIFLYFLSLIGSSDIHFYLNGRPTELTVGLCVLIGCIYAIGFFWLNRKSITNYYGRIYNNKVTSMAYIKEQNKLMKLYYGNRVPNYCIEVFGTEYNVYTMKANAESSNADKQREKCFRTNDIDKLLILGHYSDTTAEGDAPNESSKQPDIRVTQYKNIRQTHLYRWIMYFLYSALVGKDIHYPDVYGFMLDHFEMSGDTIDKIHVWVGKYKDNIYTSHILEFELFINHFKFLRNENDSNNKEYDQQQLQKDLHLRNAVHMACDTEEIKTITAFRNGGGRASLLGIQVLIIYEEKEPVRKSDQDRYHLLCTKRNNEVSSRQNFYQFVPSGTLEVYGGENSQSIKLDEIKTCRKKNDCFDYLVNIDSIFSDGLWMGKEQKKADIAKRELEFEYDNIERNCSLCLAIFREYLEEIFGIEKWNYNDCGNSIQNIYSEPEILDLLRWLENGEATLRFLGSCVDLVGLRNELCFILAIKTADFCNKEFKSCHEGKQITRVSVKGIEKYIADPLLLNPASAGLWDLFSQTDIYKNIMGDKTLF